MTEGPPRYGTGWFSAARLRRDFEMGFSADHTGPVDRMLATGSPIVATRFGPLRTWVVVDAGVARQVLVGDEERYVRPAVVARIFRTGLGRNLFTAAGSDWSRRRRLLQPLFTRAHVDELVGTMAAGIADSVDRWPVAAPVDLQALVTDLTMRVAALTFLGVDTDRDELGVRLRRHFEGVLSWMTHRFFHLAAPPAFVPTARNRRMLGDRAALRAIVAGLVAARRDSGEPTTDVLQLLLDSTDAGGRPLPQDQIVEECLGFLFAGHETTASNLAWALYHVAADPALQARVAGEGDRVLADFSVTSQILSHLRFTGAVIDETLRLYPPGVAIVRVVRRATSLAGYRVPRGTMIAVLLPAIHRDPRHWPDPTRFDPDRFMPGNDDDRRHALLPFGAGPRQCLGARFAAVEARLALALITSRWDIHLAGPATPEARVELALRIDGGLPVHLRTRNTAVRPGGTGR